MILQKLCDYYDRLDADQNQHIAQQGFAPQQITFEVVIDMDGTLHSIQDIRDPDGKKLIPRRMRLPDRGKRTSGVSAQFLWDKAEYLLGWVSKAISEAPANESEADEEKRLKKKERINQCYAACKELHQAFAIPVADPAYKALCQFFVNWNSDLLTAEQHDLLESIGTGFGVFRIRSEQQYIHERSSIRDFWVSQSSHQDSDAIVKECLVTGTLQPIARLHPPIKGFRDQQNIVVFNKGKSAYESYGNVDAQGLNAPVGVSTAFKYTTALNRLLEKGSARRLSIGETTVVFWADQPTESEDIFAFGLDSSSLSEDENRSEEIGGMLRRVAQGEAKPPDPGVGFYVLGLSAQVKARLSIRFWISGTAGELVERVARHQHRLEIARGPKDREYLPLWLILAQTARKSKDIPPLISGALLRAVLTGARYPDALFAAIVRRIRVDRWIDPWIRLDEVRKQSIARTAAVVRAATIKAILNHNYRKEISVMLDTERTDPAYQLGRLFASLEHAQEDALGSGLNATIKDRYFGAASATPASVFPRLIRLSQHHLGKLEGGKKVAADKRMQEIMGRIDAFPSHLTLPNQGLFALGYYHQRQDFFTKKKKDDIEK